MRRGKELQELQNGAHRNLAMDFVGDWERRSFRMIALSDN